MAYRTLVSPEQLFETLGDEGLVVVDCRHALGDFGLGLRLYEESHLPGAFFASVEDELAGTKTGKNGRHPLPDPERFARFLRSCGGGDDSQLVAYDAGGDMFAARFWFLSRWIGHQNVAVLDGGFAAWTALGYPVTRELPNPRQGSLAVRLNPKYIVDADYVLAHLGSDAMQLLDARARERYTGESETVDPVAGRIPGAQNRFFKDNFDENGRFKSPDALRAEFEATGLDPKRVVHQCGSGVSAAAQLFAMHHAGLEGSRVYNGSWSEWIADPTRPIERD
ncbi:MAG TPA: sulfurtransferase [Candidatus Baltobacteraceae bacterium]|nr:sulfurtransferase [Candidatus Baltobacteraceae bacterium]